MSALSDLIDIVRNTDCQWLDTRYDADAAPTDIAEQMYAKIRTEVLAEIRGAVGDLTDAVFAHLYAEHRDQMAKAGEDTREVESTTATPDFFQPNRLYTRDPHGRRAQFHVTHISTAPDQSDQVAVGWTRIDGYDTWRDYSSDDFDGWTETTEDGGR